MSTTFNLAPVPHWYFRDQNGIPLAFGYMRTYRDTVRSETKPVYADAAGTIAYVQPIVFDAAGQRGPFYWASDENYFLQVFDSDDNLVWSQSGFNAPQDGGIVPVTTHLDLSNFCQDGQFDYSPLTTVTPAPLSQKVSQNIFFAKNNASATGDSLEIIAFAPGSSVPPNNPRQFFRYNCPVAGSSETFKYLRIQFQSVYSFQNTEISIGISGRSTTLANIVGVDLVQNFGTGGSPSPEVVTSIGSLTLTSTFASHTATGTFPTITGKSLGTDVNSSYCGVLLTFPINSVTEIDITNIQINIGGVLLPYEYLPYGQLARRQVPDYTASVSTDRGAFLMINSNGFLQWGPGAPIGYTAFYIGNPTIPIPNNGNSEWHVLDGASLLKTEYPVLFGIIGVQFGTVDADHFNLPDMRGKFLRSLDMTAGVDPGRAWGTLQGSAVQDHAHSHNSSLGTFQTTVGAPNVASVNNSAGPYITGGMASGSAAAETRPINVAFMLICRIK